MRKKWKKNTNKRFQLMEMLQVNQLSTFGELDKYQGHWGLEPRWRKHEVKLRRERGWDGLGPLVSKRQSRTFHLSSFLLNSHGDSLSLFDSISSVGEYKPDTRSPHRMHWKVSGKHRADWSMPAMVPKDSSMVKEPVRWPVWVHWCGSVLSLKTDQAHHTFSFYLAWVSLICHPAPNPKISVHRIKRLQECIVSEAAQTQKGLPQVWLAKDNGIRNKFWQCWKPKLTS